MLDKIKHYNHKKYALYGTYKENVKIWDMNVHYFELDNDEEKINFDENSYLPLKYSYSFDKNIMLLCFSKHKNIMFDIIKKFNYDLFSQDSYLCIYNHISDDLQKMFNIVPDEERANVCGLLYGISDKSKLHLIRKQPTSILKLDQSIEEYPYHIVYYGTEIDDKIVSWASWNFYEDEFCDSKNDEVIDIGVGTHGDYRNRGYAVSNVVAMAEYILDLDKVAVYTTSNRNIASQKTALAAGLSEICIEKTFYFKKHRGNIWQS